MSGKMFACVACYALGAILGSLVVGIVADGDWARALLAMLGGLMLVVSTGGQD